MAGRSSSGNEIVEWKFLFRILEGALEYPPLGALSRRENFPRGRSERKFSNPGPVGKVAVNPVFDRGCKSQPLLPFPFGPLFFYCDWKRTCCYVCLPQWRGNLCRGNESRKMKRTGKELIILKQWGHTRDYGKIMDKCFFWGRRRILKFDTLINTLSYPIII